jgi:DNA-binding MarR family transcriptional regulator
MSSIMEKQDDNVNKSGFAPDGDVLEAIHDLMHLVRHRQQQDATSELVPMEARVLGFFARHPGATQSALASYSGRDKGQLARLINGLKDKGLLAAQPDESDGRVMRLSLTEQAQVLHAQVRRQRKRLAGEAVDGFSAAERAQLMALLSRVRANLQAGR